MDPEQREQMLKNEIATLKNLKEIITDAASKFKKEGNTSHEDKINAIYNVLVSTLHPDSIAYMNELNRDLYKNGNEKNNFFLMLIQTQQKDLILCLADINTSTMKVK